MKKSLQQLRSGKEFVQYAKAHGAEVRPGKGSHRIVCVPGGRPIAVPCHDNDDLGMGLRKKLEKLFTAAGLVALLLALVRFGLMR